MLRITIELVPGGNESQKKVIGVAHVSNIGGTAEEASYNVVEMTEGKIAQWRAMRVFRYPNVFRFIEQLFSMNKSPVKLPDKKGESDASSR